jgi:hypothetical protein
MTVLISGFLPAKRADSLPAKWAKIAKWAPGPAKNHGVLPLRSCREAGDGLRSRIGGVLGSRAVAEHALRDRLR